jgi:hypothetical protein
MSGWTASSLFDVVFGLFAVTIGVMQLLDPVLSARAEARARDWQLRYGNAGTDLRRRPQAPRWPAFVFIAIGVKNIILPSSHAGDGPYMIVMGGMLLAAGLFFLLIWPRIEARRLRRYEAELARCAAGSESYTDELRALHANPPLVTSLPRQLVFTAFFTLFGGTMLALGLMDSNR